MDVEVPTSVVCSVLQSALPTRRAASFGQCRGLRDVGLELTFGMGSGSPENIDVLNAKCLALICSHLGENMHNTAVQEFADFVGRDGNLIVVDPRFSVAASKAKQPCQVPSPPAGPDLHWKTLRLERGGFSTRTEISPRLPEWV